MKVNRNKKQKVDNSDVVSSVNEFQESKKSNEGKKKKKDLRKEKKDKKKAALAKHKESKLEKTDTSVVTPLVDSNT